MTMKHAGPSPVNSKLQKIKSALIRLALFIFDFAIEIPRLFF
jgi:hypothetical protein